MIAQAGTGSINSMDKYTVLVGCSRCWMCKQSTRLCTHNFSLWLLMLT